MEPEITQVDLEETAVTEETADPTSDMTDDDLAASLGYITTLSERMMTPPEEETDMQEAEPEPSAPEQEEEIEEEPEEEPEEDKEDVDDAQDKEIEDIKKQLEELLNEENGKETENTEPAE